MQAMKPVGLVTRGTTNPNRLRRGDRWLTGPEGRRLRGIRAPVVVDLGYGANPVTTLELHTRLCAVNSHVRVVGVEIEPARVAAAQHLARSGVQFVRGGFEIPVAGPVHLIRAFNVLRQYDESQVADAWSRMQSRLAPDGLIVDGTCDEIGRVASWVAVDASGPLSLTISLRLTGLCTPSIVAERLPKALIHHNVPGQRVHTFLAALDQAWERAAPLSAYGPRQRFVKVAQDLRDAGWPVRGSYKRWRLGELTVDWDVVKPDL
ncbi:MAG: class I SAM-dependent methyltransferase [Actinomycetota bacterium]|nr:class I SAM-dependent methyltransferase [Actinomycetota bacterium]